jgi:chromosome segregation ATPase
LKGQVRQILFDNQDTSLLAARTISLIAQRKTTKERANKAEDKNEYHGYWKPALDRCNAAYEKQQHLQADLDQARTKPVQADQGIQSVGEWYQERERVMNGIKAQLDEKKKQVDELEDSTRKQTRQLQQLSQKLKETEKQLAQRQADLTKEVQNSNELQNELRNELEKFRTGFNKSIESKDFEYKSQQTSTRIAENRASALDRLLKKTKNDHTQLVDQIKSELQTARLTMEGDNNTIIVLQNTIQTQQLQLAEARSSHATELQAKRQSCDEELSNSERNYMIRLRFYRARLTTSQIVLITFVV